MNGIIRNQNQSQFLIYKKFEIKIKPEIQKVVLFKTETNTYKVLFSNNDVIIAIIFNTPKDVKVSQKNQNNKHLISELQPKVLK